MDLKAEIDAATSETNTSEDWDRIIRICEVADGHETVARETVSYLAKRVVHKNVNVGLYTLTLANSLVLNCGHGVKREISSREFLDALVKLVQSKSTHNTLRTRILELIQSWAESFKGQPLLGYMVDVFNQLRVQGYTFSSNKLPEDYKPPNPSAKEDEELQLALAMSLSVNESTHQTARKQSFQRPPSPTKSKGHLYVVRGLYDFPGLEEGELKFSRGDIIKVYDDSTFREWWKGELGGRVGIFPSNYVEKVDQPESPRIVPTSASEDDITAKSMKIEKLSQLLHSIDPTKVNISTHPELQASTFIPDTYHAVLLMRPQIIHALEVHKQKQENLTLLHERFLKACSTYHRLMDAGLRVAQQPYYPQTHPAPVPGQYAPPGDPALSYSHPAHYAHPVDPSVAPSTVAYPPHTHYYPNN